MNQKIYQLLAFDQVRRELAQETQTELGQKRALKLEAMTDAQAIVKALDEVEDVQRLDEEAMAFPIGQLANIRPYLQRLAMEADLNGKELATIAKVLRAATEVADFYKKVAETDIEIPALAVYEEELADVSKLSKRLVESIADDGTVYDAASPKLHGLRQAIKSEEAQIRVKLNQLIKSDKAKQLSDQLITIRNNRFVLPVKQEYRYAFGGVVHDQSSSGQTLYIEPQSVLDANNKLSSLRSEEKEEIRQILADLSQTLMPYRDAIEHNAYILAYLDFVQAKYRYAKRIQAKRPQLASKQNMHLNSARHPFIPIDQVVANDIYFTDDYDMIVITGPNTGGKTITLKTAGLLQLMGQAGLYITAEEGSEIAVFNAIYADIGDEQSLEQSLSTFSGHMKNIIDILEQADSQNLVLIDELGSGTDPKEGAALAKAILNRLAFLQATVLTSTHYPELKAYAFDHPAAINASMVFDEESLQPAYELLIGIPGGSNALDISQRLGLDSNIVQEARSELAHDEKNLNDMLLEMESKRQAYEEQLANLNQEIQESEQLRQEIADVYNKLRADKERYLERARKEANAIVSDTKDQAKKLIGDIREWQRANPNGQAVKEHQMIAKQKEIDNLSQEERQLKDNKVLKKAKRQKQKDHKLGPGDEVKIAPYDQRGTLVEKRDGGWLVQMGALKVEVPKKNVTLIQAKNNHQENSGKRAGIKAKKAKSVKTELDLRGQRYEEAMTQLDQFIDSALLANHGQVTIIHGHGTGALRKGVHKYLRQHSQVESFEFAPYNMGGNGATIVKFKG
ncbi:endonuclease MutS2 [Aerococcus kribbianus]|uniref:Endonuclease MutS2 n=1 Tax=Aerococcus kribbianus TaxID=2999064 RepID=A0A9X3FM61_9LACT|nr:MULTISPECIES: endonuclease MutS2 [unclassified Aerococcus]MCZ0717045.1 endonuclease MutS2 [Aerococcus sp. YH-aer221]MCZ0725333.1 endonuclease MutS2 [Aerococcus sp. YH-aer222]